MSEKSKRGAVLSIGTELTSGIIQDLHGKTLSSALTGLGFQVNRLLVLPDDQNLIEHELKKAAAEAEIVLLTGGLGPTSDDLTREAVAAVADKPLEFREESWQSILDKFPGRKILETNRKQACIPEGFEALENRRGTAAGFWGMMGNCVVAALPGPPGELQDMFDREVMPRLQKMAGTENTSRLWATSLMIPESELEDSLQHITEKGITWGTRTEYLRIVFNLQSSDPENGIRALKQLQQKKGAPRVREGIVDAPHLLVTALKEEKTTLAGAESCTGGLIGKLITDIPGSSAVFWGTFVTYANEAKTLLGVPEQLLQQHGAVSPEVTEAMAQSVLKQTGTDVAFAVSGVAGPEGGTAEKPVGTVWLSVQRRGEPAVTRTYRFHGNRESVRRRAACTVLLLTEALVKKREILDSEWNWEYI